MAGRPKIKIDYETVKKLASIMCTEKEIASFLGCNERTLQRDEEFCRIFKEGKETGKMSLRRMQWKLAEKSYAMAIFLGKNYLGQRDNFPDEVNFTDINMGLINISKLLKNPVENRNEDNIDE